MANQTGGTRKKGCCLGCALVFAGGLFLILLLLVAAILFWDDEESSVSTESSVLTISDIAGSTEASVPFTPAENADNYYYQLLSESEQSSYQKMLPEMEQHLEKFDWSWSFWDGTDGDAAIALLDSIYADNPEMFWLSAYQFSQVGTSYRFEYWIPERDIVSELAQVQAAAAPIIAQAKQIPQEYDRALYLYQTVIERIDYEDVADEESAESNRKRSVLGGLIDGKAVCAGYAKTFQYLANASGIRCTYVTGTSRSVGHAWNLIWIDGQPYYCDPTWGDSAVNDGMEYTDYFYFCMTQDELFRTHEIETPSIVPPCTATDACYYRRNGWYLDHYDYASASSLLQNQREAGMLPLTIQFGSEEQLLAAATDLAEEDMIFEVFSDIQSFSYWEDPKTYILRIVPK